MADGLSYSVEDVEDEVFSSELISLANKKVNPRYIEDGELADKYEELCEVASEFFELLAKKHSTP